MIRNILHEVGGIGIFGISSMLLFVTFFLCAAIWAALLRKPYVAHMSHLPLEPDEAESKGEQTHE